MARQNVKILTTNVTEDDRKAISDYAVKERNFQSVADYLRTLIEDDMRKHGKPISLDIRWGREPKAS